MDKKKIANAVIATALTAGLASASTQAVAAKKDMEKCFGIAKAGKNLCGTAKHACAGQSKVDGAPSEWTMVAKGTCDTMAGGGTTAAAAKAAQEKLKAVLCKKDEKS